MAPKLLFTLGLPDVRYVYMSIHALKTEPKKPMSSNSNEDTIYLHFNKFPTSCCTINIIFIRKPGLCLTGTLPRGYCFYSGTFFIHFTEPQSKNVCLVPEFTPKTLVVSQTRYNNSLPNAGRGFFPNHEGSHFELRSSTTETGTTSRTTHNGFAALQV